ncbi:MAG: M55 family metallopeptidase [Bacilli bacterium]
MKIFISADIEGINSIVDWSETELGNPEYEKFRLQMTEEVKRACIGAHKAGATEIFVKDAHDSARNIIFNNLPDYVTLHRGWQGCPASMMAGLDKSFDAVIYTGYHSPSRSNGNPLSHTMNTKIQHVKINGEIASEFVLNSYFAASQNVPIAFLSGDYNLTKQVQAICDGIETVATKQGVYGAVVSKHPNITNQEIEDGVYNALKNSNYKQNVIKLPRAFDVEVQYKKHQAAYSNSFFPGCKLVGNDRVLFHTDNVNDLMVTLKFIL